MMTVTTSKLENAAEQDYMILLYYYFTPIEDPLALMDEQRNLCKDLSLKGRILIAPEGINGTVSGTREQATAYMDAMRADPRFQSMVFKIDAASDHAFPKMSVKFRNEIVRFDSPVPIDPTQKTGIRLAPKAWLDAMNQPDAIILDGRSDYEYDLGHFRGAIRPDLSTFREFPAWIDEHLKIPKDRPLLTYCTGGIRCEKLSAYLLEAGFTNVAQLEGGIVTYGKDEATQGARFDGKCYVFDERQSVPINHTEDQVIVGRCHHCETPTERFINCKYDFCHNQHLCCDRCLDEHDGFCSSNCKATYDAQSVTS